MNADILYEAALAWKELMQFNYIITYGYKKQLHTITLTFPSERFHHLSGFQYLSDLRIPRFNRSKILEAILCKKITFEQIKKGCQYEDSVKPRLEALIRLKQTIEEEFILHSYMPQFYSFNTQIKADYLISRTISPIDFIFIIRADSTDNISVCDFVCCSAFTQTNRDYRENQRPRTILKKERICVSSSETVILYDKLSE